MLARGRALLLLLRRESQAYTLDATVLLYSKKLHADVNISRCHSECLLGITGVIKLLSLSESVHLSRITGCIDNLEGKVPVPNLCRMAQSPSALRGNFIAG